MAYPSDLTRTKNWGTETLTDSDLEGQLDLIIAWVMSSLDASTGHNHTASANKSQKINVGTGLTVTNQALGDILYASSASAFARLAGNTTTTKKYLTQTGDGAASAAPTWDTILEADLPAATQTKLTQGVIKAWASITYAAGVPTLNDSYNVSGITDNDTGDITITWDTDFASVNYAVVGICKDASSFSVTVTAIAVGYVTLRLADPSTPADPDGLYVMAIGD